MVVKLLYFSADWCGPCETQSPIIDEVKDDYTDTVKVKKVDVDENQELSNTYQVRSIPTIIILTEDEEGQQKLQERFVGVTQKEDIEDSLDSLIE